MVNLVTYFLLHAVSDIETSKKMYHYKNSQDCLEPSRMENCQYECVITKHTCTWGSFIHRRWMLVTEELLYAVLGTGITRKWSTTTPDKTVLSPYMWSAAHRRVNRQYIHVGQFWIWMLMVVISVLLYALVSQWKWQWKWRSGLQGGKELA